MNDEIRRLMEEAIDVHDRTLLELRDIINNNKKVDKITSNSIDRAIKVIDKVLQANRKVMETRNKTVGE